MIELFWKSLNCCFLKCSKFFRQKHKIFTCWIYWWLFQRTNAKVFVVFLLHVFLCILVAWVVKDGHDPIYFHVRRDLSTRLGLNFWSTFDTPRDTGSLGNNASTRVGHCPCNIQVSPECILVRTFLVVEVALVFVLQSYGRGLPRRGSRLERCRWNPWQWGLS